ncbi:hypothetical protein OG21DRAFT_1504385 [Imleria badia]|nr:hypothetical protein OG21DRAFT_1504385 [Imleria badia]
MRPIQRVSADAHSDQAEETIFNFLEGLRTTSRWVRSVIPSWRIQCWQVRQHRTGDITANRHLTRSLATSLGINHECKARGVWMRSRLHAAQLEHILTVNGQGGDENRIGCAEIGGHRYVPEDDDHDPSVMHNKSQEPREDIPSHFCHMLYDS